MAEKIVDDNLKEEKIINGNTDEKTSKTESDITPIIDFNKTEEFKDDYEETAKQVKADLFNQFQIRLLELIIGIAFILLTTKTGVLGTFLFIAALFYLIPDGLIKTIMYFIRYRHYEDYVENKNYKINDNYIEVVMTAIRKKGVFSSGKSEDND